MIHEVCALADVFCWRSVGKRHYIQSFELLLKTQVTHSADRFPRRRQIFDITLTNYGSTWFLGSFGDDITIFRLITNVVEASAKISIIMDASKVTFILGALAFVLLGGITAAARPSRGEIRYSSIILLYIQILILDRNLARPLLVVPFHNKLRIET